jgi:uncharacterized membrane protein YdbT with pleckstrin-like domain
MMNQLKHDEPLFAHHLHWAIFILPALLLTFLITIETFAYLTLRHVSTLFGTPATAMLWALLWPIAVLSLLPLMHLGFALNNYYNSRVCLMADRLVCTGGLIFRTRSELLLRDVETTCMVEPLLGRLLGYGTVVAVGKGGTYFPMRFVPQPQLLYNALRQAVDRPKF